MAVIRSQSGVYVEEISTGVRRIEGVATSVAAFVGRTPRGPVDAPTTCTSFSAFARAFGDLATAHPMTYAVRDFFFNGGREAVVVRLFRPDGGDGRARLTLDGGSTLMAVSPGNWGNAIRVTVAHPQDDDALDAVRAPLGLARSDFFDLTVDDLAGDTTETFRHVSTAAAAGARRLDGVLAADSRLVGTDGSMSDARPAEGAAVAPSGGDDGSALGAAAYLGDVAARTGMQALEAVDAFNLLCIPPDGHDHDVPTIVWQAAAAYCVERRAFLLVDPPASWVADPATAVGTALAAVGAAPPVTGIEARNAALYFPRLSMRDPLDGDQVRAFAPCGALAGLFARTDATRGVWKAPAGRDATLLGVEAPEIALTAADSDALNPLAVNGLRALPGMGTVVWGARTMRGRDQLADEYQYVPVRRLALFLEECLVRGLRWAEFEPNGEPLWAQLRASVGSFLGGLFRQGAFQGVSPGDAYFVRCDATTTTQADIDRGIVHVVVGFSPLRPAEFLIVTIEQRAGPA